MSILTASIYTSVAIKFNDLFEDELTEMYKENYLMQDSNIYFVGKIAKVRFDVNKTYVYDYHMLNVTLLSDVFEPVTFKKRNYLGTQFADTFLW